MDFLGTKYVLYAIFPLYLQPKNEHVDMTDFELQSHRRSSLAVSNLDAWRAEPVLLDQGTMMRCRQGCATLRVNFDRICLQAGSVLTLFPGDVVRMIEADGEFAVECLVYNAALLREASLQVEHTVYEQLRQDRCRGGEDNVSHIVDSMFALLRCYFAQPNCACTDTLVLLQLKAFFLSYSDYMSHNPDARHPLAGSRRVRELFSQFMMMLEKNYMYVRDVNSYAERMNISAKYLNAIVQQVTGRTAKTIIDHFVVLQLKLTLRNSQKSVKEIAWDYHFSDLSFFCRYFKQHIGQTPQQFRKSRK